MQPNQQPQAPLQPQPQAPAQPMMQPMQAPQQPQQPQQQFISSAPSRAANGFNARQANAAAPATPAQKAAAAQSPRRDNPNSSQSSLLISELRDSMVIMKDGSFRAVVACQSINFDLMSEEERESVEYMYQNFLNSLSFNIQILIRSQRIDISPYIDHLIKLRHETDNMLLGAMMDNYIEFIDVLSQEANIMDKSFFIVIPYYTDKDAEKALEQSKNFFKAFNKNKAPATTRINRATYDKAITEMNNRVEAVISGLFQMNIQSVRLNTKELAQLYYNFNNPDTAVHEPLGDFNKLAHLYVKKGEPGEEN